MDFIEEAMAHDKTHKVAVIWTETGILETKAESVEEAIKKVDKDKDNIPLPEGDYLDGSFEIDVETTKLINT